MRIINAAIIICYIAAFAHAEAMVEIAIEVTEINNNMANQLGIKWLDTIEAGELSVTNEEFLPLQLPQVPSLINTGEWSRYSALKAELRMLQEKGAAQILSKPKILTKSGSSARVLIGGEIPIVASGVGGGTIDWKQFGIKAEILPKIIAPNTIDLILTTEVSRLDWANSVNNNPALMKREASSNLILKSGQTIAIAGLIESKKEERSAGIPLLSDIPVLGYLFSRKTISDVRTNILIFVTPRIIE